MTVSVPDPQPPAAVRTIVYGYPLTPPPTPSITDATQLVQRVLDIVGRFGDEIQAATVLPYPCAVCHVDLSRVPQWEWARHFARHSVAERARVVGWFRAVMGT